jgi:membrane protein
MIRKTLTFIKDDIWRIPTRKLSPRKSLFVNQLRIVLLAFRGFAEDQCQLRASALTFYTLLSIVPVVAMAFGIAKGFKMEELLQKQLEERFAGHEEVMQRVLDFSHSLLEETRGGVIAGMGVLILFWTVVKLLGNIESSFNDIWGIREGRSLTRKFSDYLAIMLICPILLAIAGSVTVFIATYLKELTDQFEFYGLLRAAVHFSVRGSTYLVIWMLFTFLYLFLPNTQVRLRSALPAGIIAGILYQLVQGLYITGQVGLSRYNAVYGSFAALPFFLVWVQASWLIVLFGAELAFATQNVDTYEFEPDSLRASAGFRFRLILLVLVRLIRDFDRGMPPASDRTISQDLDIPMRLTRRILFDCLQCGLLREVKVDAGPGSGYQPATDSAKYTIAFVAERLLQHGGDPPPVPESPELERLAASLCALSDTLAASPANLRLRDCDGTFQPKAKGKDR